MQLFSRATVTWLVVAQEILSAVSFVVSGFNHPSLLLSLEQANKHSAAMSLVSPRYPTFHVLSPHKKEIYRETALPLSINPDSVSPGFFGNGTTAVEDPSVFSSKSALASSSPWDVNPSIPNSIASIDQIVRSGVRRGQSLQTARPSVLRHHNGGQKQEGMHLVNISGRDMVNFGSCSYLGLETHPSIFEGICDAARKYGSQYSSSRVYSSNELYDTLESMLSQIYDNRPVMVTPTTTLGHISTLPVLIGGEDVIIMDMQVHSSVQTAAQLLKARDVPLKVIRHNDMDMLESAIKSARANPKIKNIWYLADGVYSMYGDYADFDRLKDLLDKYDNFHLYIDDAHGVSWTGKNGCGVAWSQMNRHDRMVLAISLNKSFATSGGAIVFANEAQKSLVRNCGGPMVFSGPVQPPMLGAACASVQLHMLSSEIIDRQERLSELIRYCDETMVSIGLPQYSRKNDISPIFFIPVGKPDPSIELVGKVANDGYYINSATYPAVPMRRGGVRIVLNHHLTKDHIKGLLNSLRKHYGPTLRKHNITKQSLSKNFKIPLAQLENVYGVEPTDMHKRATPTETRTNIKVEIYKSIHDLDRVEWDQLFFKKGHSSQILSLYERVFDGSTGKPEDRWDFTYFVARKPCGAVVAATFFTQVLSKDDMLSSASISEKVEQLRQESSDPYLMSSGVVMMGTPLSSGDLLYLDRSSHSEWKDSLILLTKEMEAIQVATKSTQIFIRGLTTTSHDGELEEVLLENAGFSRMNFMDQFVISDLTEGGSSSDFLAALKSKQRSDLRRNVLKHLDDFIVETTKPESNTETMECYNLYSRVHERSHSLSTYQLPQQYFKEMVECPAYDILRVYRKDSVEPGPIGMIVSSIHGETYICEIIGFDRGTAGEEVNVYELILYSAVERAISLGCIKIDLGFTCGTSKRKFGCDRIEQFMFVQVNDFFGQTQLAVV